MKESSRLASIDDLETLIFLRKEAISELKNKRGGEVLLNLDSFSEDSSENFSFWFDSSNHRIFTGLFGDAVVAYGVLEFSKTNDNQKIASIKEIFVLKDARSVGVGESVIHSITNEAIEHNAIGIDSFALPGDRETKNFFETQGMVARLIHVYRPLESN
ncbi:MAG: hypothetical protein CL469_07480 [Acidimicrobiaceae bacterium]|uniref:N-acetyltransferase domain-containing protein n=1 Tax=marine metagenome TaxID=408172 RepID=A0A382DZE2_9ZZZZ|nr:hypothetical protein [Acidimicrobiaceae bacterium]